MWSSNGGAASWPVYQPPGYGLTLRANTDAGLVFLIGGMTTQNNGAIVLTRDLPPAFRPLQIVQPVDTQNRVFLSITPDGQVTLPNGAAASSYAWRTFYFSTVTPA